MRGNWSVYPVAYVYWHQKEQFLLDRDTNDNWTMFAVEDGRFAFEIGERSGEAAFGDLVVCPPGYTFHRKTLTPLTFHFVQFMWEIEPTKEELLEWTGKITLSDIDRLASTYRYMRGVGDTAWDDPGFNRMRHLLGDIWWLYGQERGYAREEVPDEADPEMQLACQWLLRHAFEPFAMSELSDMLGISPVQLTRRFSASYGITPSAYVTRLRIDRACRLLEGTALTLDQIAQQCGYENGFYLSRVFRNRKGMPPSAYRKLHQV